MSPEILEQEKIMPGLEDLDTGGHNKVIVFIRCRVLKILDKGRSPEQLTGFEEQTFIVIMTINNEIADLKSEIGQRYEQGYADYSAKSVNQGEDKIKLKRVKRDKLWRSLSKKARKECRYRMRVEGVDFY